MDYKTLIGIIGSLVSLIIGVGTMITKLNKQSSAIRRTEARVGPLGQYYFNVRKLPVTAMWWGLLFLCIFGLLIVLEGVAEAIPVSALQLFPVLFYYWLVIPLGVLFLSVCAIFDLPTRVLLFLSWARNENIQFDPGYINTRWQLEDPEASTAMNVRHNNCEHLGVAILNLMVTQANPPAERAPVPAISQEELANYIFFGCVIEHYVHVLIKDRSRLHPMWTYMAWVAASNERPFTSAHVRDHAPGEGYFKYLQNIGTQPGSAPQGQLPISPTIKDDADAAARWLVEEWKGDAIKLATSNIFGRPSPETLLDNLEKVSPFTENDGLKRLFLKLSARMRVWPQMEPGPFLYPYYRGIALLLLNSGCIVASDDIKRIDPDTGFRSLVALAEDNVTRAALAQCRNQHADAAMQAFSARAFNSAPLNVDEWAFLDYIDLWMFTHTFHSCTVQTRAASPTACALTTDTTTCFCVKPQVEWRPEETSFVRD